VEIAREKAGIAKPGLELVLGAMPPDVRAAIDEVAHAAGATTTMLDESAPLPSRIGLAGAHQRDNARIAAELGRRIGAAKQAIEEGLAGVRWPGRLERIGNVLLDAAHNPDGAEALAAHVRTLGIPPERTALVFGTLADKDCAPMLDTLAPLASTRLYVAPSGASRSAVDPSAMVARHAGAIEVSLPAAIDASRQATLAIVAGSLVLVGQARALLLGLPRDPPVAL
jgi:dihydrofolate synthase / folylpolyglutamate synthase